MLMYAKWWHQRHLNSATVRRESGPRQVNKKPHQSDGCGHVRRQNERRKEIIIQTGEPTKILEVTRRHTKLETRFMVSD
jgi:hypothetical protein